ncbi:MAG: VanZ family protein [Vicinamibacteraceae bacterium]
MPQHRRSGDAAGGPLTAAAGASRRRTAALVIATAASVALILAAPAIGSARSALRAAFPGTFSRLIASGLALVALVAIGVALVRIRTHRVLRYGALGAALAIAWSYSAATGSPDPAIRAVERVHFVEFGLIAWLFLRVWRDRTDASAIVAPALATCIAGIGDEAFQWFLPARVGELADVALNAVAIGCGLLAGAAITPPADLGGRWTATSVRLVARLLALTVVALAAFVHVVHLGQRLEAPGIGTFASRYSAAELDALDRERAAAWRQAPPLVRPPRFSREDQYMTEGLQHVQARNLAWDRGDAFTAWRENLVLERFFAAVLDTPSYVARDGHRWRVAHRADAERRAAGSEPRAFESRAFPYPIYPWSPVVVWLVALAVAIGLWTGGNRLATRAAAPAAD